MINEIKNKVYKALEVLELLISIMVGITIAVAVVYLLKVMGMNMLNSDRTQVMNDFIGEAFTVVIGIEFVKMLTKHKASTVVEVLLFAIARQMVVEHTTPVQNLVCVLSIAVLFAVRKYFFHRFDEVEKTVFHPLTRVIKVNKTCGVHLPYVTENETVGELFLRNLDIASDVITKGTCAFFEGGLALRASKARNGEALEIELIHSMNSDVGHTRL